MHTADTRKPNLSSGKPEKPEKNKKPANQRNQLVQTQKKISGHFSNS